MQVNLLCVQEAAPTRGRQNHLSIAMVGTSPLPMLQGEEQEFRDRVRRAEEKDAAAATLVPTRSADVIAEAERNVDHSSRAFRRQVARETATEQFRQDRQAFRQALTEAKGQGTQTAPQRPGNAAMHPHEAAQDKLGDGSRVDGAGKGTPATPPQSARPVPAPDSAHAGARTVDSSAAAQRLASSTAAGGGQGNRQTGALSGTLARSAAAPVVRSDAAAIRTGPATQAQAAKAGGSGVGKGGGPAPAVLATRGPARAAAPAAARATASRPARTADWDANIERLVRVLRSRINGQRSRTVLRLDPPELGRLRLQMDLRGAALTLRIDASTEMAHRLLSQDVEKLRHGLEASGIQLERVEIRPPTQGMEAGEHDTSEHAETQDEAWGGSAETDAEHSQEQGTDSHLAESSEGTTRGTDPVPAAESLVNVVA
jgi:flagellar hook-length control protein FliK